MFGSDFPRAEDESLTAQILRRGYRWLRFPEPLEQQYREDHRAGVHQLVRVAVIVSIITSAGFTLIDLWMVHAYNAMPLLARLCLQLPALIIGLLATSRRFYLRWYEPAIRVGLPLFGIGTVLMTSNAPVDHMPLIGGRLLLVTFFCYFMLGLRLRAALVCNGIVFAALVIAWLVGAIPFTIGSYLAFALACANVIGASGAYALEYAHRTAFLDRLSLEELAARDGLTRLLNRQTFEFRARGAWKNALALQHPIAVLMIDVDYFKRYNDFYGHQAGDECLQLIASAVKAAIKPQRDELVARYGGEEFVALLVDRTAADIEAIARNIVECVARQTIPHGASVIGDSVTVSVGACSPCLDIDASYSALAHIADKALYMAKHQGRNRAVVLAPKHNANGDAEIGAEGNSRPEARGLPQRTPIALSL